MRYTLLSFLLCSLLACVATTSSRSSTTVPSNVIAGVDEDAPADRHEDLVAACPSDTPLTITAAQADVYWHEEWRNASQAFRHDPGDRDAAIHYARSFPLAIASGSQANACAALFAVRNYTAASCSFQSLAVRHLMRCYHERLAHLCPEHDLARQGRANLWENTCGRGRDNWYQP